MRGALKGAEKNTFRKSVPVLAYYFPLPLQSQMDFLRSRNLRQFSRVRIRCGRAKHQKKLTCWSSNNGRGTIQNLSRKVQPTICTEATFPLCRPPRALYGTWTVHIITKVGGLTLHQPTQAHTQIPGIFPKQDERRHEATIEEIIELY